MTRRREALIHAVGTPTGSIDHLSPSGSTGGGSGSVGNGEGEVHSGLDDGALPTTTIITPDGGLSPMTINAHVNHAFQTSPNKVMGSPMNGFGLILSDL